MSLPRFLSLATIVALTLGCPTLVSAQVLASQLGRVAQTVDGTTITVEYYRPVARGRPELFGRVVKWDETWTPGANWATTLEVDKDVRLNNHPLPKGKYSVWIKVQKDSDWTVMINRKVRAFHVTPPPKDSQQLAFAVKPEQGPHLEVLTWSFPAVMRDGTQLRMQWGTTVIPILVSVEPSRPPVVTAEERQGYVGKWAMSYPANGNEPASVDTVTITDANGTLRVRGKAIEDFDPEFELVPIGGNQFHPSFFKKGASFGVEPGETLAFKVERGKVLSLELIGADGMTFGRGVKVR
jgi:hypothetical protein